jgi:glutaminase
MQEPFTATAVAWALQPSVPKDYVSTGQLPRADRVKAVVNEAYEKFKTNTEGKNADHIPALAKVPSNLFGICVVNVDGAVYSVGDVDYQFSIQSVSKPFVFALVCEAYGHEEARKKTGVNATGLPFNSLLAIELNKNRTVNPLVNAGAIAAASFVPGATADEKWKAIRAGLSEFAGRELSLNEEVYKSEAATNQRNQSIARLLKAYERITFDPDQATDVYTKQCSLNVTAKDLAVMGATLANGGVNPLTKKRVIDAIHCQHVLAVMATAGMYETSGDWLYDIGMPGKSGVGGGIVCISPGKGGLGTLAPPLDVAGNSVKGQLVAKHVSEQLGLNIFASAPTSQR